MTVSRALNNRENVKKETREMILETAKKMGYRPNYIARSLVTNKTNTIGVVVPEISHSFFPEVIRGIEEVTYEKGYNLILMHSSEDAQREVSAIATLESKQVDGILISIAETVEDFSIYKNLVDEGYHLVFFDRCVKGIGASCVRLNDIESARKITQHLIKKHRYKRIAHLKGPDKISIGKDRLDGFLSAMKENNLKVNKDWIVDAGLKESEGKRAMSKLLDLPKSRQPRAVIAVNAPVAFGAIEAIKERGLRIPEDIAIVAFSDNIRAQLISSPLTTVRQPAYEIGRKAAEKLISSIESEVADVEDIVVNAELVIRRSCGCTYEPEEK